MYRSKPQLDEAYDLPAYVRVPTEWELATARILEWERRVEAVSAWSAYDELLRQLH